MDFVAGAAATFDGAFFFVADLCTVALAVIRESTEVETLRNFGWIFLLPLAINVEIDDIVLSLNPK
jgi:hypothetical protein